LESADSPQHSAESGSLSYGPPVRLRLLSTSPHGDAVTFDYEVMACLDADLHRADVMPSRAHGSLPTPERRGDARLTFGPDRLHSCASRRSEEHTSELQSRENLVCRLLL